MIPAPYLLLIKIGLIGVLLASVFGYGHHLGSNSVKAAWDSEKAKTALAVDKLKDENEKHNAEVLAKQQADNVKVSTDHENALQAIAKKYDRDIAAVRASGGLRIPLSACSGSTSTGTETASTSGHHEDFAASIKLPDDIETNLFSEARRADEIVEQARACQSWILKRGFYQNPIPSQPEE